MNESIKISGRPVITYRIVESGIMITTSTNSKLPTEEHVPFEHIKNERFYYVEKSPTFLILAGVFLLIFAFVLINHSQSRDDLPLINYFTWPLLIFLFTVCYFALQPKIYYLKTFTAKFLKFKINNNELEVAEFVEAVITRRNEHLRLKYGMPNPYLSYDAQFSNFNIMVREQVINATEYQAKIEALNKLFNQTRPMQTFGTYSQN